MRRYDKSQADQSEVLDDCCHMISASGTLCSKGHVIKIASFFEHKLYWAWNRQREIPVKNILT